MANKIDQETADMICHFKYQNISGERACGHYPLCGLLAWGQKIRAKVSLLDLRNSGDTAGDKTRVVGYGSFLLGH
jgi:MEMO1 family protein